MAAKWQQWMPFHIDRFRGSPAVQAMHPCARAGYLYLLASAWQTDDCTLPNDPIGLAELSGLGDELWAVHGPRILRNFTVLENGVLQNSVLLVEWSDARERFGNKYVSPEELHEIRSAAGRKGNELRWKDRKTSQNASGSEANSSQTDRKTSHTVTGTVTSTDKKQKTLAKDKPSPDSRAAAFRQSFGNYFQTLNSAPAPWDAKEATRLSKFLQANPTITAEQWTRILNNRRRSPVAHGKRLSVWIDTALSWLAGPADEWGKALNATGGRTNGKGDSNLAVLERVLAEDQDGAGADGDVPAGDTRRLDFKALLGAARQRAV